MAQKRLDEQFGFSISTPIYNNLQRMLTAIEMRFQPLEAQRDQIDAIVDSLTAVALSRLDDVFTPLILDAQQRLEHFGANFAAISSTTLTIGLGEFVVYIDESQREGFVFADYVVLRAIDDVTNSMTARVDAYDRTLGRLDVTSMAISGSGTFSSWQLTIGVAPDISHNSNYNNPHNTTAAQVGAYTTGAIDTFLSAIDDTINTHTSTLTALSVQGSNVVAGNTTDLSDPAFLVDVTGSTTINGITLGVGQRKMVRFTGTPVLTHSGNLLLPGAANITAVAGDFAQFVGYAAGVVRCSTYFPIGGYGFLTRSNTWSKPQTPAAAALTSGVAADFSASPMWTINVSGSTFTVTNPSTAPANNTSIFILVTFTSNNTLAFGNKFKVGSYIQSTSGKDALSFVYDSGADAYYLIGVRNGITL